MNTNTNQGDLLAEATFAKIVPIKMGRVAKQKAAKGEGSEFQPVVLAEAPAYIQSMPENDLEQKASKAIAVMRWAMERFEICFSYSGGKDSSTVLSLGLAAAAQMKSEGVEVKRFAILNSDTLVESPEVLGVVKSELRRIQKWIDRFNLPGEIHVTTPSLGSQFAVSIIGGKSVISTPVTNRNCTTDMKSVPLTAKRKAVFGNNDVSNGRFSVGVTGVRFDESAARGANMAKRAESPVQVVQTDEKGSVFLAPIAYWSTDDVMEWIGLAVNNMLPVEIYSDFVEVWRIYKDAEGECSVGRGDKPSKGCSARHGCYICNMVSSDKSMNAMLAQERYAYMQPLSRFREFLMNTLFDLSNRTWVGRSIENGYIKFAPDAYAPHYLQKLLQMALTIDVRELEESRRMGIKPRFQIVSLEALFAIDAMWSLQGFARPFTGLKIYRDVYLRGERYEVPIVERAPKVEIPKPRYIYVGKEWDDTAVDAFSGLRDPLLEMVEGSCSSTKTIKSKGELKTVMDVQTSDVFSVNAESAMMILEFELDRLVDLHHGDEKQVAVANTYAGQGYKFYLSYGMISLSKNQVSKVDQILRRTAWRERLGLAGYNYNHAEALAMSIEAVPEVIVTEEDLRREAQQKAEEERQYQRRETYRKSFTVTDLYKHWSPDVPWRQLLKKDKKHKSILVNRKVPAYCLNKDKAYVSTKLKGWALHHFVFLGELVQFIKANPAIQEKVKAHRSPKRKRGYQMDLLAA